MVGDVRTEVGHFTEAAAEISSGQPRPVLRALKSQASSLEQTARIDGAAGQRRAADG